MIKKQTIPKIADNFSRRPGWSESTLKNRKQTIETRILIKFNVKINLRRFRSALRDKKGQIISEDPSVLDATRRDSAFGD